MTAAVLATGWALVAIVLIVMTVCWTAILICALVVGAGAERARLAAKRRDGEPPDVNSRL